MNKIIKEEIENVINSQKQETLTFEKDPMEYILQKYPSLDATLVDLMTDSYKDYIIGVYCMAPKPTIFKILLHNGQYFYLTYTKKGYIAKVSGKQYFLINLKESEYAIKSISKLLLLGIPPSSVGPVEEQSNEPADNFIQDMTSEPDLTSEPNSEPTDEVPEEEPLQEEEIQSEKKYRLLNI